MLDLLVLGFALSGFIFFVLAHLGLFRFSHAVGVIGWLVKTCAFVAFMVALAFLVGLILGAWPLPSDIVLRVGIFLWVFVLFGILSFSYVICCVGPYETSVRLRIVREIPEGEGLTLTQLRARYDNSHILDIRLQRLLASKDIIDRDGFFLDNRGNSIFTGITRFSNFLRQCYGIQTWS